MSKRQWELKETVRCSFCGGSRCKRCGEQAYQNCPNPALQKIHSSWVGDEIIAMQRPSDEIVKGADLLQQFKDNNIVAIFNLTEPGEHPYCGNELKASGFPYSPEIFMSVGVKHFNYAWQDMTAPSMSLMLDIVQIALSEIYNGGRIAVHCHAGLGRTGICIAAILIVRNRLNALEAISFVRAHRKGSIQTSQQQQFVKDFYVFYRRLLIVYPSNGAVGLLDECVADNDEQRVSFTGAVLQRMLSKTPVSSSTNGGFPLPQTAGDSNTNKKLRKGIPLAVDVASEFSIEESLKNQNIVLLHSELLRHRHGPRGVSYPCDFILFSLQSVRSLNSQDNSEAINGLNRAIMSMLTSSPFGRSGSVQDGTDDGAISSSATACIIMQAQANSNNWKNWEIGDKSEEFPVGAHVDNNVGKTIAEAADVTAGDPDVAGKVTVALPPPQRTTSPFRQGVEGNTSTSATVKVGGLRESFKTVNSSLQVEGDEEVNLNPVEKCCVIDTIDKLKVVWETSSTLKAISKGDYSDMKSICEMSEMSQVVVVIDTLSRPKLNLLKLLVRLMRGVHKTNACLGCNAGGVPSSDAGTSGASHPASMCSCTSCQTNALIAVRIGLSCTKPITGPSPYTSVTDDAVPLLCSSLMSFYHTQSKIPSTAEGVPLSTHVISPCTIPVANTTSDKYPVLSSRPKSFVVRMKTFVSTMSASGSNTDISSIASTTSSDGGVSDANIGAATFICLIFAWNWSVAFPVRHTLHHPSALRKQKSAQIDPVDTEAELTTGDQVADGLTANSEPPIMEPDEAENDEEEPLEEELQHEINLRQTVQQSKVMQQIGAMCSSVAEENESIELLTKGIIEADVTFDASPEEAVGEDESGMGQQTLAAS